MSRPAPAARHLRLRCILLLTALGLASGCEGDFPAPGSAGSFVVDSRVDALDPAPGDGRCGSGRGTCTLRAAVMESNALAGPNTIVMSAGTHVLSAAGQGEAERGDLDVRSSIRVLGAGMDATIIDASNLQDRIFDQHQDRLQLVGLTLRNGGSEDVDGGGVRVESGALLLRQVALRQNRAFFVGGGLQNAGIATLEDCTFDGNTGPRAGAVANTGTMGIERCTFSRNSGGATGGLSNAGGMTMVNSTVSGNTGNSGTGGVTNTGSLTLVNVTITDNVGSADETDRAGGLANSGVARIGNTLIANNRNRESGPNDCAGELISEGYNLVQDPGVSCTLGGILAGNLLRSSPSLTPLQNNGGPTETHLLQPGSPGRDMGSPASPSAGRGACRPIDQRGEPRPQGGRCDIGATEE